MASPPPAASVDDKASPTLVAHQDEDDSRGCDAMDVVVSVVGVEVPAAEASVVVVASETRSSSPPRSRGWEADWVACRRHLMTRDNGSILGRLAQAVQFLEDAVVCSAAKPPDAAFVGFCRRFRGIEDVTKLLVDIRTGRAWDKDDRYGLDLVCSHVDAALLLHRRHRLPVLP